MNWKSFFKPSIGKIILFILLLLASFFISMGMIGCGFGDYDGASCQSLFGVSYIIVPLIYILGSMLKASFLLFAMIQLIYCYFRSTIVMGFFNSVKNKESYKMPLITLILVILILFGMWTIYSQTENSERNDRLIQLGWAPQFTTQETCENEGLNWVGNEDLGYHCVVGSLSREECNSKGLTWKECLTDKGTLYEDPDACERNERCIYLKQ